MPQFSSSVYEYPSPRYNTVRQKNQAACHFRMACGLIFSVVQDGLFRQFFVVEACELRPVSELQLVEYGADVVSHSAFTEIQA